MPSISLSMLFACWTHAVENWAFYLPVGKNCWFSALRLHKNYFLQGTLERLNFCGITVALINPLSLLSHLLAAPQPGYPPQCLKFIGYTSVVSRLQITAALLLEFDSRSKDSPRKKDNLFCLSICYNRRLLNMSNVVRLDSSSVVSVACWCKSVDLSKGTSEMQQAFLLLRGEPGVPNLQEGLQLLNTDRPFAPGGELTAACVHQVLK